MRRNIFALIVAGCLGLFFGCGGQETDSAKAPSPAGGGEKSPLPKTIKVPVAPNPLITQKTRDVYRWYCTQCHGLEGKGDGINARLLTVPPRNHTKADYLESRTDQQLFDAIKLGGLAAGRAPCMPAWGHTLDDETIHSLVAYVRELCQCESTG